MDSTPFDAPLHGPVSRNLTRAWPNISQKSHCLCVTIISLRAKFLNTLQFLKWIRNKLTKKIVLLATGTWEILFGLQNMRTVFRLLCHQTYAATYHFNVSFAGQLLQLMQFCTIPLPNLVVELIFVVLALQLQPITNRVVLIRPFQGDSVEYRDLSVTTKTTPSFSIKHAYYTLLKNLRSFYLVS